jgi:hypothetical protein
VPAQLGLATVVQCEQFAAASTPSQAATLTNPVAPGNTVVVIAESANPYGISSISGLGIATWLPAESIVNANLGELEIFYGLASAGGSAAITVNWTSPGTSSSGEFVVMELLGAGQLLGVVQNITYETTGAASYTSTATATPGSVIISGAKTEGDGPSFTGVSGGWTALPMSNGTHGGAYAVVAAGGAQTCTYTLSGSDTGATVAAVFGNAGPGPLVVAQAVNRSATY